MPLRTLLQIGILGYPPARVDHRFKDGDTIRVGPIALTAHVTGGSTRGCTSWSFPVRGGERVLRSLPADIWVTNRARPWGRYRKFVASHTAKTPVDAFIDPEGYRAYIDTYESEFWRGVVH